MEPGHRVADRFVIEERAGAGAMGVVFRARDEHTGERVALKVVRKSSPESTARFARETDVLAELNHPGIVRYVSHGETSEGQPFLAMEWLEGIDLAERLARGPLEVEDCRRLGESVADALGAAHVCGVVHRDVKPANLFLVGGRVDAVKLVDFGVARLAGSGGHSLTVTGRMLGTPNFMSPEQVRGARDIDARADVFSLGAVLFRCLAGAAPFQADDVRAVLIRILFEPAQRIRELHPDVPEGLDQLIARMLAKDPADRPLDGAAVALELAALEPTARTRSAPSAPVEPRALTDREQRLLSVVLIAGEGEPTVVEDPTDADRAVSRLMDELRGATESCGASVEPLADGSVVVTLSGVSSAVDQAIQAARCALAIRARLGAHPMALATGRAQVLLHSPVGEVIDRAAGLLRVAEADLGRVDPANARGLDVRVDAVTVGLLRERFEFSEDAHGAQLRGERVSDDGVRRLLGRATSCVGREREINTLEQVFAECASESAAAAVLVTAPAGGGKSRIRQEWLKRAATLREPPTVLIGRGDPMREGSPFGMIASAVRGLVGIRSEDSIETRRARLRARIERHTQPDAVDRTAMFLGELVGAPDPSHGDVQLQAARRDGMLMGEQMRRALENFLRAECEARPVVLVLEDLQWGDRSTVRWIDTLLGSLHDRALMVLALARPEVREVFPKLWSTRAVTDLSLRDLPRKACEQLAREVLGESATSEAIERVITQAAGNAFYLEELIRTVADGKGEAFPPTLVAVTQARLESLDASARRALRAASVFGRVFRAEGVAALLGGTGETASIRDELARLVDSEVLLRRTVEGGAGLDEHVFRHALVREAAYATLTESDRTLGHRLAGDWLERAGERDALLLAEHFQRGGAPERAIDWYAAAAHLAMEGNDFVTMVARAEQAIASGASGESFGRLRWLQSEATKWAGDHANSERYAREAMAALPTGTRHWYGAIANVATACGRTAQSDRLAEAAADLHAAERCRDGNESAYAIALARVVLVLQYAGNFALADRLLARITEIEHPAVDDDPAAAAMVHFARANGAQFAGDAQTHLELLEKAVECHRQCGDVRRACELDAHAAYARIELGDYDNAIGGLRVALALAEPMGVPTLTIMARQNLGLALARGGQLAEAREVELRAIEEAERGGGGRMEGYSRVYLAMIERWDGRFDEAEREARHGVEILEIAPPALAQAHAVLADVLLAKGDTVSAMHSAESATAILSELGKVEEGEALIALVHAEALAANGHRDAARRAIESARERIETRAARMRDESLRRSFLTNVGENARILAFSADPSWPAIASAD